MTERASLVCQRGAVGASGGGVVGAEHHDPPVQPVRQREVGNRSNRLGGRSPAAGDDPPQASIARDRLQPLTQAGRIAQYVQLRPGDDKSVLDYGEGIRLRQDAPAVGEQGSCVPAERGGEPVRVAGHDRRDQLWFLHSAYHIAWLVPICREGAKVQMTACP